MRRRGRVTQLRDAAGCGERLAEPIPSVCAPQWWQLDQVDELGPP